MQGDKLNIEALTVYQSPYPKVRLGRDGDGGYVIADIPCIYSVLLAGGVGGDVSFERDLVERCRIPSALLFDKEYYGHPEDFDVDAATKTEFLHPSMRFHKKNIARQTSEVTTNLHEELQRYTGIFVKMDIEGSEYEWLEGLDGEHLNSIDQMVIEFHLPHENVGHWAMLSKINRTHLLVHLHPNNFLGLDSYHEVSSVTVPIVFECTYVHKRFSKHLFHNDKPLPTAIDQPNFADRPELKLDWAPFCVAAANRQH